MGFFLLGRDEDEVRLIVPALFPTRHEALAELSRLSALPDAVTAEEIFVLDLDSGTPVLIVPRTSAVGPQFSEEILDAESAAVWEAPVVDIPGSESTEPEFTEPEPESTEPEFTESEPVGTESESELESLHSELQSPEPDTENAESQAEEPELETEEPESESLELETIEAISGQDIDEKLMGDDEVAAQQPLPKKNASAATLESDEAVLSEPLPEPESISQPIPAIESEPEVPSESWPWDLPSTEIESEPEDRPEPESPASFVDPELESEPPPPPPPAVAEPASVDEPVSVEPPSVDEPVTPDEPTLSDIPEVADSNLEEPSALAEPEMPTSFPETPEVVADTPLEDLKLSNDTSSTVSNDSMPVPADKPIEPDRTYEAGGSDLAELSCEDCVYLDTCPKRGESDPASCGSFQWKSV